MAESTELRNQLRSLTIPKDQRPGGQGARARRGGVNWILLLAVLGLAGYIGWEKSGRRMPVFAGGSPASAPAPELQLVKVTTSAPVAEGSPVLTATGKIVSDHQVEVSTKVSGQVVALHFEQGDAVERGQVLAEIESVLPRARRDEAAANLDRARAIRDFQEVNFARVSRLAESNQASDIELADARRGRDEARAQVSALEAGLEFAEKVLRDCRVEAPISGVVLERAVEVGDFVAAEGGRGAMANAQFAAIADMTKLRVEVDVNELDVARLRTNMSCLIVPDAQKNRRYTGHVLWIDPGANYAKATVQVKVRIHDPDGDLRVEGAAQVQFLSEPPSDIPRLAGRDSVWIPASACLPGHAAGTARVLVNENGRLVARSVSIGQRVQDRVEIVSGLKSGEEIAADPNNVREGELASRQ